ncbi:methyltransferase domain-containing protein [Streptomyces sp. NPDC092296]|uniref:methyltransferase domain-containing protein n=1 Tax=Streptomyces sp. NPDC092296 TaxID=3366012 RepID=UPI0037FDCE54
MDVDILRRRLADAMERRGDWPADSPWVRLAVEALPRDRFAPDLLWQWDGHRWVSVERGADPERWARVLFAGPDEAAVTQVCEGLPSSSLSCPAVVADMLDSLILAPGHRVLELGTGNGWNAALLARRAGPGRVTSVEVDPALATAARRRLAATGAGVAVEVGDGAAGWAAGAPYDRVVATYAVERVPWAWVAQTRPGGRIVTPWGHLGHVALTVAPDGRSATGWVQGLAQFMPARGTGRPLPDFRTVRGDGPAQAERPLHRDLGPLRDDAHLRFALRVALPRLRITTDGESAWLHDGTSWATLSALGPGRTVAHQGGPRRLADDLERAWDTWLSHGSPKLYDYGMTVEPTHQYLWCHDPTTGPRWPTPDQ